MLGDAEIEHVHGMINQAIELKFAAINELKKLHADMLQKLEDCYKDMRHVTEKLTVVEEQVQGHMVGLDNVYKEFQKVRKML